MKTIYLALLTAAISFQAFADDSAGAFAAFRNIQACPSTFLHRGECPGYQIVYTGAAVVENMKWMPAEIKTAAGTLEKDGWERDVYCQ